ncbi:MAG: hypothetical protein K1X88_03920 [Nannocystaceae bacterium]|nr:hypothetical protein [Nannocystaceae bacterium]
MLDKARSLAPSKLRYHFDNAMAWSGLARFMLLVVFAGVALAIGVIALYVFAPDAEQSKDGWEAVWWSWGRVMDPGTGTGDEGAGLRLASILTTIVGLCVFVLLIGFVATAVQENLERLRQTGAPVAESGHTVVLGFSDNTLKLLEELALANQGVRDACVVILSRRPKSEIVDAVLSRFGAPRIDRTRIVVREGSCTSAQDLLDVAVLQASSVVVMPDGGDGDSADVRVVKALLVLLRGLPARPRAHLVAEVENAQRIDVIASIDPAAHVAVVAREFLSRLMIQSIRQPGLARVYGELLSFVGDEFYLRPLPAALVGRRFGDACLAFDNVIVCGLARAGERAVLLSPVDDEPLRADDRLLVLAQDADVPLAVGRHAGDGSLPATVPPPPAPQRLLVVGYRPDLPAMLQEIDTGYAAGSEVTVLTALAPDDARARVLGRTGPLRNVAVEFVQGDTTLRETLERVTTRPFDAQVLVGDTEQPGDAAAIDARTLMTLLLIRGLEAGGAFCTDRLVSEIRDPRTKQLATITALGDFVVSDELVSQLLAQVSMSPELAGVWTELTTNDGCELYVKPAALYVRPGESVSFFDVIARARARGEVAIGWNDAPGETFALNPRDKTSKRRFAGQLVVIARDDG